MNLCTLKLLLQHQGFGWAAYRARHAIEHKLGVLERRAPAMPWDAFELIDELVDPSIQTSAEIGAHWRANRQRFLFDPSDRDRVAALLRGFDDGDPDWPTRRLDDFESGKLSYFSNPPVEVGFPPKWNDNLLEDRPGPEVVHFSRINEFGCGDVKCIWEPNRFGFVYDLVRIYWRTGDERAAELFWRAVEDWYEHNPPNTGINWKCGQESSLRAMAWCFGLWGFAESEHTTDERIVTMQWLMVATGQRVEAHIGYAISQNNNHGVSEAMGLFTIGTLFPKLPNADRWQQRGRKLLERQARELIDDDGGFSQYSANYHRVMLHDYLYAIRIGDLNDAPLSDELKQRIVQAGRFIRNLQDSTTGEVPRYGNDDGALILPLTNCAYEDFRPVTQSTGALSDRSLPWLAGESEAWNEEMFWLFGANCLDRPHESKVGSFFCTGDAGCQVLRSPSGMAMMRAGGGRFRPAQLDQLHVDIRHRGINIALDPGTYSYNAQGEWADIPFSTTGAHNTVMVDGVEHAERISRFLFLPPPVATVERFDRSAGGGIAIIEASLDVYSRLRDPVSLCRALIQLGSEHWLVIDSIAATQPHLIALAWNLPDLPHEWKADATRLTLSAHGTPYSVAIASAETELDCTVLRAAENDWRGWYADRYHSLKPCLRLEARATTNAALLVTAFGPGTTTIDTSGDRIKLTFPVGEATVKIRPPGAGSMVASVSLSGPESDTLTLD